MCSEAVLSHGFRYTNMFGQATAWPVRWWHAAWLQGCVAAAAAGGTLFFAASNSHSLAAHLQLDSLAVLGV